MAIVTDSGSLVHRTRTTAPALPYFGTRSPNKPLSYLPVEIIQEILSWLRPLDYDSARLISRQWFAASLSRSLLESNLHQLSFPTAPKGACPSTCPCKNHHSFWLLRKKFADAVMQWPGSRFRVRCSKSVLSGSAILDLAEVLNGPPLMSESVARPEFECVGFSRPTGSFAGVAVGKKAKRRLYIYRIFSRVHTTFQARPHRQSCCPCNPEPGPLYMVFDIKTAPESNIVQIHIDEVENPSSVQNITIIFASGMVESYSFQGLAANRIYQLNMKDTVVHSASAAHRERRPSFVLDSSAGKKRLNRLLHGLIHRFHKHPHIASNGALLELRKIPKRPLPQQARLQFSGSAARDEICRIVSVPLTSDEIGVIAVNSANLIYVLGFNTSWTDGKGSHAVTTAYLHHWIYPPTSSENKLTHISVAPLIHYDFVSKSHYMGIIAGYENGEIWVWRIDRDWTHIAEGRAVDHGPPVTGIYSPVQSPCVSSAIPCPLDPPLYPGQEILLPVLQVVHEKNINLGVPNARAGRLDRLPGLRALSFVGRGVVILAADGKDMYIFDLREANGFERGKLNATHPLNGLP